MGLWVFGATAYHVLIVGVPRAEVMGVIGFLALAANVTSVLLLAKYKDGDANVRSVWLCSRNDAIGNVAVMIAALAVWGTATKWPDLMVAAIMAGLFLYSSAQILKQAIQELRTGETAAYSSGKKCEFRRGRYGCKLAKSSLDPRPAAAGYCSAPMAFARTIFALLIAASVALLPAAGAAAFKLKSQDATEMSATEPTHDCCPPAANPCDKAMDDCGTMATCALKCFSSSTGASSPLSFPLTLRGRDAAVRGSDFHSQTGSPPFRPPRV